jgi:hypothetical protein
VVLACACSPAKGEPVGVSHDATAKQRASRDAGATAPLAGLPADFRRAWPRVGARVASEHGRFAADVYRHDQGRWAEDLFAGDAGVGVYLLERGDSGVRFAVADPRGRVVADSAADAGPSLAPCARCHAGAKDEVYPVVP